MVNKVLTEAASWVGYLEKASNSQLESFTGNAGYNNYTIFAQWYKDLTGENYQAQPWCAMFVSCVLVRAIGESVAKSLMPMFAYCPTGVNNFKADKGGGKWITSNPQAGDIIFFHDGTGVSSHVGIVTGVGDGVVSTIEGNTSSTSGVVANGGGVFRKSYNLSYSRILGYGRPNYTVQEDDGEMVEQGYVLVNGEKVLCDLINKDNTNYVKLRSLTDAGFNVVFDDGTKLPAITNPQARAFVPDADAEMQAVIDSVKDTFGLEDKTITYLRRYEYGDELLKKMAAGSGAETTW